MIPAISGSKRLIFAATAKISITNKIIDAKSIFIKPPPESPASEIVPL